MQPKAVRKIHAPIKVGDKFGRFEVIAGPEMRPVGPRYHLPYWTIRCPCGATYTVKAATLLHQGRSHCRACMPWPSSHRGFTPEQIVAARIARRRHGMTGTPIYRIWRAMKVRCTDPKSKSFKNYGARKILVCPEWMESFEAFYRDMGPRPTPKHMLDRLDNSRGYEPGNCAWRTPTQQSRNRRNTVMVETPAGPRPLADLTEGAAASHALIRMRIKDFGWPLDKALNTPPMRRGPRPRKNT